MVDATEKNLMPPVDPGHKKLCKKCAEGMINGARDNDPGH